MIADALTKESVALSFELKEVLKKKYAQLKKQKLICALM
jgi:hypothetical protein